MRRRLRRPASVLGIVFLVVSTMSGTVAAPPAVAQQQGTATPDVYEPDDSPSQAHPLLLVGIPQRRSFHTPTDTDWAYIVAEAGERVVIYTTGPCDTFMTLVAPDGETPLAQDDDSGSGSNALLRFGVPVSGEYLVRVRLFSPSAGPCEAYELVGQVLPPPPADAFEPDNTPDQAQPLSPESAPQEHNLHAPGDQDWLSLQLPGTTGIRLLTEGLCDTYLYLYAPDRTTVLAEDDDGGQTGGSLIVYTIMQGGTYYARVRHFDEHAGICDSYTISLTLTAPTLPDSFEPDDASSQAKPLILNGTPQTHSIHAPGDTDWVRFPLAAGDRVFLFTEGQCDTYLYLYAPDGRTVLTEDDDSGEGTNAAIFFRATESGTHFARVRLFGERARTCSAYQLSGISVPAAGAAGPTATPTTLPARTPTVSAPSPTAQPTARPSATRSTR